MAKKQKPKTCRSAPHHKPRKGYRDVMYDDIPGSGSNHSQRHRPLDPEFDYLSRGNAHDNNSLLGVYFSKNKKDVYHEDFLKEVENSLDCRFAHSGEDWRKTRKPKKKGM